jgi:hypothetical protein
MVTKTQDVTVPHTHTRTLYKIVNKLRQMAFLLSTLTNRTDRGSMKRDIERM